MAGARTPLSIIFLFLLPGLGLAAVSVIVPVRYLYRNVMWTRTEGLLLFVNDRDQQAHPVLEFNDDRGIKRRVAVNGEDSMFEGSDAMHFVLYYNPSDSTDYVLMNPGRYLLLLFFPFGLLLCYLGWPERARQVGAGEHRRYS
jgi:hypothetical protein